MQNTAREKKVKLKSLRTKILIVIGLPVMIAFLIAGSLSMNSARATVYGLTDNELAAKSQAASYQINEHFQTFAQIAKDMAGNQQFRQIMADTPKGVRIAESDSFSQIMDTMINLTKTDESILATWLADIDSSQLWTSSGFVSDQGWDITQRGWYASMMNADKAGEVVFTEPYWDDTVNLTVVTMVMPIYRGSSAELIGAAGVDIAINHLSEIIQSNTLGEKGFYILVSGSGQILYHPDQDYLNKAVAETDLSESLQNAVAEKRTGNLQYSSQGQSNHGYVASVGDSGWLVISGLPDDEFKAPTSAMSTTMIVIFLVADLLIGILIIAFSQSLVRPLRRLTEAARQIARGNLNAEISVNSNDETGRVSAAMKQAADHIRSYISEITRTLRSMGEGDMRIELQQEYIGDFAPIKAALLDISSSLNRTLLIIKVSARQVDTGAAQVSSGAQALAAGAAEQAAGVEELSASISQVAEQAEKNLENVNTANEHAQLAGQGIAAGNRHMEELTEAMANINSASGQIANIAKAIEDIAFQTNILALNAAIEAARAGAAGKGFAVVADEVRNLAAKSAEAAKETGQLIERSVATVSQGSRITAQTAQILQDVQNKAEAVVESIDKIEQASVRQTSAISQIRQGLSQVSAVVQTNAATAEENSAASEEMSAQAAALREEVGKFKLQAENEEDFTTDTPPGQSFPQEEIRALAAVPVSEKY